LLNKCLVELARYATSLPFSITEFQAEIDTLSRLDSFSPAEPDSQHVIEHCDQHIQTGVQKSTLLHQQIEQYDAELILKQENVAQLEKRSEIAPQLEGYEQFEQDLRNAMLTPRPLFQGLEWSPSVKQQERRYIEECIGEEILGTLLLRKAEYEKARELCTNYSGLRICSDTQENTEIPDWMRQVFDIKETDPACLLALAMEMESSGWQPEVHTVAGKPVLAFRGHERSLCDAQARLIGSDSRRKALAAEIRDLHKELQQLGQERKAIYKTHTAVEHNLDNIKNFKKYVLDRAAEIRDCIHASQETEYSLTSTQLRYDTHYAAEIKLKNEVAALDLRLRELGELIAKEGLENLEKRIKRLQKQRAAVLQKSDVLKDDIGGDRREIFQLEQTIETIRKDRISLTEKKETE